MGNYGRPRTAAMLLEAAEADANRPQTGAMGFPGTNKVLPTKNSLSKFTPAQFGGRAVSAGMQPQN